MLFEQERKGSGCINGRSFSFIFFLFDLVLLSISFREDSGGNEKLPPVGFLCSPLVANKKMGEDNYHPFEIILGFLSVEIAKIAVT